MGPGLLRTRLIQHPYIKTALSLIDQSQTDATPCTTPTPRTSFMSTDDRMACPMDVRLRHTMAHHRYATHTDTLQHTDASPHLLLYCVIHGLASYIRTTNGPPQPFSVPHNRARLRSPAVRARALATANSNVSAPRLLSSLSMQWRRPARHAHNNSPKPNECEDGASSSGNAPHHSALSFSGSTPLLLLNRV